MSDAADIPEVDRLPDAPHPREASVLVGHRPAEAAFLDAYRGGRFPHAWILGGPEGIGKATFAYRAARFLLANPDPSAPAVQAAADLSVPASSPVVARVAAQSHGGLFVLRRQWNAEKKSMPTQIPVEFVRRSLDFFASTAALDGWRVCIVDSAEDLNANGANALLKTLEEPPSRALFLIVSHVPGRLLPTIRSRCRMLSLRPLGAADLVAAARAAGSEAPEADLLRAVPFADGSVRQLLKLMDEETLAVVAHMRTALSRLPAVDWTDAHAIAEGVAGRANDATFEAVVESMFTWLSEQAHAAAGEGAARLAPLAEVWDKIARALREARAFNLDRRALILSLFSDLSEAARLTRAS
ncbi:DNA polymerase III subunit delta' [Alsobacter sp. R-9]